MVSSSTYTRVVAWWQARQERRRWAEETLLSAALRERPGMSGWPLAQRTGIHSGQVYVVLARMEAAGRVTSWWAEGPYGGEDGA